MYIPCDSEQPIKVTFIQDSPDEPAEEKHLHHSCPVFVGSWLLTVQYAVITSSLFYQTQHLFPCLTPYEMNDILLTSSV